MPVARNPEPKTSGWLCVFLLTLGAGSGFYVRLGGQLHINEIAALLTLPRTLQLLRRLPARVQAQVQWLAAWSGLWALTGLASGLYRSNETVSVIRAIAVPLFTLVLGLAVIAWTELDPDRIRVVLWGVAIGGILGSYVQPSYDLTVNPWKYGVGMSVTLALAVISTYPGLYQWGLALLLLNAALTTYLGARTLAALGFATALLTALNGAKREGARGGSFARLGASAVVLLALSWAVPAVWSGVALSGRLGPGARDKVIQQGQGVDGFISGRPEVAFSMTAIEASPVIGYGLDFKPTPGLLERAAQRADSLGIESWRVVGRGDVIPTHSYLFGTWVGYGILALGFWVAALRIIARGLVDQLRLGAQNMAPLVLLGISFMWNLFFSPYGDRERMWVVATLCVCLAFSSRIVSSKRGAESSRETGELAVAL